MTPEGDLIKWMYIKFMYEKDKILPSPKCPRLTNDHFRLNNTDKMRVPFATQVNFLISSSVKLLK